MDIDAEEGGVGAVESNCEVIRIDSIDGTINNGLKNKIPKEQEILITRPCLDRSDFQESFVGTN